LGRRRDKSQLSYRRAFRHRKPNPATGPFAIWQILANKLRLCTDDSRISGILNALLVAKTNIGCREIEGLIGLIFDHNLSANVSHPGLWLCWPRQFSCIGILKYLNREDPLRHLRLAN
jgi:hypothetical protein